VVNLTNQLLAVPPRLCGYRIAGDAYIRTRQSPWGKPIEYFLICPPEPVDKIEIGLADQGIRVLPDAVDSSINHVWDWVGATSYTVPEFIEEAANPVHNGTSRHVPAPQISMLANLTYGKSRHIFVADAMLVNPEEVYQHRMDPQLQPCPRKHEDHNDNTALDTCLGLLWEINKEGKAGDERRYVAQIPCKGPPVWTFPAGAWPKDFPAIQFVAAAFMWFPIERIDVVFDNTPEAKHERTLDLVKNLGNNFPYVITNDETGEEWQE
jgi:hypothetical protein